MVPELLVNSSPENFHNGHDFDVVSDEPRANEWAFTMVEPTKLEEVWDLVREDLPNVIRKTGYGYRTERVYMAILQGSCSLFMGFMNRGHVATVVLAGATNPLTGQNELTIVSAEKDDQDLKARVIEPMEVRQRCLDSIEEIARGMNVRRIGFHSTRRGWLRQAPKLGFRLREYTFVKDI